MGAYPWTLHLAVITISLLTTTTTLDMTEPLHSLIIFPDLNYTKKENPWVKSWLYLAMQPCSFFVFPTTFSPLFSGHDSQGVSLHCLIPSVGEI